MHSYEVEYWYRWNGDDMDVNYVTVEAEDEEMPPTANRQVSETEKGPKAKAKRA